MSRNRRQLRHQAEALSWRPLTREDELMRFMLLQNYGPVGSDCPPMTEWSPADIRAHIEFQHTLNRELLERGELVDAQGLAGPEQARRGVSDGTGVPGITDGPVPGAKAP